MNEDTARKTANLILGAAAVAAAVYIARTPPLRRLVWRLAVVALTQSAPAWLAKEIQQGWTESNRRIQS